MTYKGTVKNGVIVLKKGIKLPEGASVEVEVGQKPKRSRTRPKTKKKPGGKFLSDALVRFVGVMEGDYPPDFAENHDHYIHGTPKRAT